MPYDIETCEKCGAIASHVTNSRPTDDVGRRRRHACIKCGHRWSTVEIRETELMKMREPHKWGRSVEQKIQDLLHEIQNKFLP